MFSIWPLFPLCSISQGPMAHAIFKGTGVLAFEQVSLWGPHEIWALDSFSLCFRLLCFFLRNLSALSSCCVSLWEPWQRLTPLLPLLSYQVLVNNFVLSLAPFHKQQKKRKEKRFISLMCQYSLVDDLPLHFVRKFCKWGPGVKISPFAI